MAISSLVLKQLDWLDWIFLIIHGITFGLNDFQYAYQAGHSTTMATWAVLETVDYFLRNGSEVFTCAMDMTSAFDLTLHSLLFEKMIAAGFPAIFIRLFIFIYMKQVADVRWNGKKSKMFRMTNGCRQGVILSAIAYCFYCEELFSLLRKRRAGCWVEGTYCGLFGYSDDNWALAPSLDSLQKILDTCQEYAASHNLKFSTDPNPTKRKTKCMGFLKDSRPLPRLLLCGNSLPWVQKLRHLGNTIENRITGGQLDNKIKNAIYIQKNITLNQEFSFAHPKTKIKVNCIYNTHFTGCQLWNLFGHEAQKLESHYNRSVKIMCGLPYSTHRYFVEHITERPHVRKMLIKRYLKFIQSVEQSPKHSLTKLLKIAKGDVRSVTGSNMRYHTISESDKWRLNILDELFELQHGDLVVPGMEAGEISTILDYICTS